MRARALRARALRPLALPVASKEPGHLLDQALPIGSPAAQAQIRERGQP